MPLMVAGFHRSLSSSLSKWLHQAGLNMGHYLMPPAVSNPEGHFEDMPLVELHDRLLRLNGTTWRFHDESDFDPAVRLDLLRLYLARREATAHGPWGAKDPRTCLFLPAWRQVLGDRGDYLVLLRHWSGSVQSLLRRHAEALAVGEGDPEQHADFWREPEMAARMWLAYHRRVLSLLEQERDRCLVVTQQALLAGLPIIEKVNEHFGLALDVGMPSPIRHSLSHDRIETGIRAQLSGPLVDELDATWQRLLAYADHHAERESPLWVQAPEDGADAERLLEEAHVLASTDVASPQPGVPSDAGLQAQLAALTNQPSLPLDVAHWQARIELEARFVPECWEFLARAQLLRGDALGAEQYLTRVLLCGKVQPYLFLLLGTCREAELDDQGAEHYYRQGIARNDANATFHVRLCRLLLARGEYTEAEEHLRQTLSQHQGKPPLLQALAECIDQRGATVEAIGLLEEQSDRPPLLESQLVSLRMKLKPEEAHVPQHALQLRAASHPSNRQRVLVVLAGVQNIGARHDLARRVSGAWGRLGVATNASGALAEGAC